MNIFLPQPLSCAKKHWNGGGHCDEHNGGKDGGIDGEESGVDSDAAAPLRFTNEIGFWAKVGTTMFNSGKK